MLDAVGPAEILPALLLGYLLGSVPFGLLLTRLAGTRDIRTIGSGNIGATNVLRTGRKDLAAATLLLDALKGTAAVLLADHFWGPNAGLAAALGAFAGHVLPVWLRFQGGKGVATFVGCLFGAFWPVGLVFALVWILMAGLFRFSSAAALTASFASPLALAFWGRPQAAFVFALLTLWIWWTHRANIGRLLAGTEGRIGQKA